MGVRGYLAVTKMLKMDELNDFYIINKASISSGDSVNFRLFIFCSINFDRPDFHLGGRFRYISKPSVMPLSLAVSFFT